VKNLEGSVCLRIPKGTYKIERTIDLEKLSREFVKEYLVEVG